MTNQELSDQFDVLYNNITSNQAPGLDAYEKSVFFTKAQDEILESYFNPRLNKTQEGFDNNEGRQIAFSSLIVTDKHSEFNPSVLDNRSNSKSVTINIKNNIMFIINEFVDVTNLDSLSSTRLTVVPLHFKEYSRLMSKAYKRPNRGQAWRLTHPNSVELIVGPDDSIESYIIRYVKKPTPIILEDLEGGLKINELSDKQECELDPIIHPDLVQRAAELAKAVYTGDLNSQIVLGSNSQTNIGAIPQSR